MGIPFEESTLTREQVDQLSGPVVLEFGTNWCGICSAFAPRVESLFAEYPGVRRIRVEDGPGKPLGRSFQVKLWPTFVFLRDGQVHARVSRPSVEQVRAGLAQIAPPE